MSGIHVVVVGSREREGEGGGVQIERSGGSEGHYCLACFPPPPPLIENSFSVAAFFEGAGERNGFWEKWTPSSVSISVSQNQGSIFAQLQIPGGLAKFLRQSVACTSRVVL